MRLPIGVLSRAGLRALRSAGRVHPRTYARRTVVDPHWRRQPEGGAARLGARETIDVGRRVGRFHGVDPRLPNSAWSAPGRISGAGLWAAAVAGAWWLGRHGRGPLASVADLDRLGSSLTATPGGADAWDDTGAGPHVSGTQADRYPARAPAG